MFLMETARPQTWCKLYTKLEKMIGWHLDEEVHTVRSARLALWNTVNTESFTLFYKPCANTAWQPDMLPVSADYHGSALPCFRYTNLLKDSVSIRPRFLPACQLSVEGPFRERIITERRRSGSITCWSATQCYSDEPLGMADTRMQL